jgi:hypothetical protein
MVSEIAAQHPCDHQDDEDEEECFTEDHRNVRDSA